MNKLLQQQIHDHFGETYHVPEKFSKLFSAISGSYDQFQKEHCNIGSSIKADTKDRIKLDTLLIKERDELRMVNSELKTLFEGIDKVLYSADMISLELLQISAACKKVYGYTSAEFFADNKLWQKVIHPDDRHITEQYIEVLTQGKQVLNQYRIIHKDKSIRWLENMIIPTLDETGRLIRIGGVTDDISERKRVEQESEKSFSILEATIESTGDGILVTDLNGKLIRFNKKLVELWRIPAETLQTQDDQIAINYVIDQLIDPEKFLSKLKELQGRPKEVSFDVLEFKDGRIVEWYSQPQLINGECAGRVWSFRDITARKKNEEALQESEKRLRQIIDLVPHFIFAKDAKGKFILGNEAVATAYGCTVEELLGKSDADFNPNKEEVEHFIREDLKVISSGNTKHNIEETITDAAGNIRVLSTTKIPYTSPGLDVPGVLGVCVDISERKKAEKLIKESELRYRSLIEQATDAICIADASMKFIDVNPYACQVLGYSKKESLELSVTDIIFLEDLKTNPFKLDETKSEDIIRNERRFKRKDGTSVLMEVSTKLMEDGRFIMFGHDISERKKAETILKESENQLSMATQIAKLGYWEFDVLKGLFTFNDQFYSIFKTTTEEVGGNTLTAVQYATLFVYPDDRAVVGMGVPYAINSPDSQLNSQIEHRIIYATGEIGWISVNFYLVKNDKGQPIKTFGVNQDITDRKNAEAKIRRSEEKYRHIVETTQEGIWLVDENNQTSFVNKRLCELLGYSEKEMLGKEVFYFLDEEGKKIAEESIEKRKQGGCDTLVFKFMTKTGAVLWTYISYSSVMDDNGKYVGTLAMITDITQRKLHEELLQKSEADLETKNKQLEQKNKELEQFAYVASHDMQEPLRTTSSFVELLQSQYKGKLDEKADKYLSFIAQSSDRMKVLIKDLLDYSRIGRKLELVEVDCNKMLKEVLADLGTAINETNAEIKAEHLPVINGYPTEIKQLFQNLVINAIKFRQKDIPPKINISAGKSGGCWQFAFKDNGIGIEEKHKERIFIIFQRLHNRNQYEGSGIGLSHCKKIVELHKGRIWVDATPGKGSTFHFTISKINN